MCTTSASLFSSFFFFLCKLAVVAAHILSPDSVGREGRVCTDFGPHTFSSGTRGRCGSGKQQLHVKCLCSHCDSRSCLLLLCAFVLLVRARDTGQVELHVSALDHRFALLLRSCKRREMSTQEHKLPLPQVAARGEEDGTERRHAPLRSRNATTGAAKTNPATPTAQVAASSFM